MRRIRTTTGATFETTDVLAEALLQYCWALADQRRRDVVRVPVRQEDGSIGDVVLLLGADLGLTSESSAAAEDELDPILALDLDGRTHELRTVEITWPAEDEGR